jgi:hypothetical protein
MVQRVVGFALALVAVAGLAHGQTPADKKASPLRLSVEMPSTPATVAQLGRGEYDIKLIFTNAGNKEIVLWPYVRLEIRDSLNQTVPEVTKSGRWGKTSGESILEQVPFVTLRPGQSHKLDVNLGEFRGDADVIKGWALRPGEYKLLVTYEYEPGAAKKKYGQGGRNLDNPSKPWNKALKAKEDRTGTVRVRKD